MIDLKTDQLGQLRRPGGSLTRGSLSEIFRVLILYELEHIARFSNLH